MLFQGVRCSQIHQNSQGAAEDRSRGFLVAYMCTQLLSKTNPQKLWLCILVIEEQHRGTVVGTITIQFSPSLNIYGVASALYLTWL